MKIFNRATEVDAVQTPDYLLPMTEADAPKEATIIGATLASVAVAEAKKTNPEPEQDQVHSAA